MLLSHFDLLLAFAVCCVRVLITLLNEVNFRVLMRWINLITFVLGLIVIWTRY